MGKKLYAFLGKWFKTSKFKPMVNMAISRLAVLKKQRQGRCLIARSDVVEFLKTGNHERALLRVEQVIKEQNMLDVFILLEGYYHLLIEMISLIEQEKECPEELREAVSSLIYAATRCGEFPELQEIRVIFTSRFGKEFANQAIELRNNCSVNPKIVQKLSTKAPSLETKMEVLKEIASENDIVLQIEETTSATTVENQDQHNLEDIGKRENYSDSSKMNRKYKDVADAAQAAFESAAYAAAAARVAVELSRSESTDPDDPNFRPRGGSGMTQRMKSEIQTHVEKDIMEEDQIIKTEIKFEKIHPVQNQNYDTEAKQGSLSIEKDMEKLKRNDNDTEYRRSLSDSSADLVDDNVNKWPYDESDTENEQKSRISPIKSKIGVKIELGPGKSTADFDAEKRNKGMEPLNINRRPISVRTKWTSGR